MKPILQFCFLIRAGREIRGQNSFFAWVRKKWNRESRERTRKKDEDFLTTDFTDGHG